MPFWLYVVLAVQIVIDLLFLYLYGSVTNAYMSHLVYLHSNTEGLMK